MSALVVAAARYLLYGLVLVAALVWVTRDRAGRLAMLGQAALGLALVGAGIVVAGALHVDPRPFVTDPASTPLFPHPADNGFPSDHAAAAGLLTALVGARRRALGLTVGVGAVLIAVARVAAHVHHAQDVVAGLAIGLLAGACAVGVVDRVARRRTTGR
ncbi:hypothetical protein DQ238_04410 [Geodermatophilus sp. TF02-6]|uniref:phosphatase PAP2 family protein n=1 Tax=Geodermatophilus sp. TF02-6 TaxID=2250575 RepID=UPI000DE95895|nr:phosphatase PAP2 family protein [Geodermatophilus sp. TF02-6]RBY82532.1 hypothetical protein DQ238_04410 [Geodermatophilus sp. TF02-6]